MQVRRIRALLWLSIASVCFSANALDTRAVVSDIANLIENNYFDPAAAADVASDLRKSARTGSFDRFQQPRDLATELTARLKQVDQHFLVIWLQEPPATGELRNARIESVGSSIGGQAYGLRSVAMLPGGIGYIELRSFAYFSANRPDDPARLAADAALQLIANSSAVVLDLRNCIGGYAQMASYFVSAFTGGDADIFNSVHGRDGEESERPRQTYRKPRLNVPLYVLVSGATASAGESAAYTLQAAKRAIIVGERTSGAANPGGLFPVRDGFNVFISIGTPVNPITKANWEGQGVQPDVNAPSEQALHRAQRLALEAVRAQANGAVSREVDWALEALLAEDKSPARVALADYAGTYSDAVVSIKNGSLQVQRGRRAVQLLAPLRADLFFVVGEPTQRIAFERDASGTITGFQLLRSSAYSTWFPRR